MTTRHQAVNRGPSRRLVVGLAIAAAAGLGFGRASAQSDRDLWIQDMTLDAQSEPLASIRRNLILDVDHLRQADVTGMAEWRAAVEPFRSLAVIDRITAVNDFVNQHIRYINDWDGYHVPDHWAVLSETVFRGAGDCEDFAIAKLETLVYLDMDPQHLALMVGYLTLPDGERIPHAVAAVLDGDEPHDPWVLGNVDRHLHRASERPDFSIVYAAIAVEHAPEWLVSHVSGRT